MQVKCKVCHRPLTDLVSIALGVGPVCRVQGKQKECDLAQSSLFASEYKWGIDRGTIWIKDLKGIKSVTADIKNVLSNILKSVKNDTGSIKYRIMYKDYYDIWDEILVDSEGNFMGFSPLTEIEYENAYDKLQETK